MLLPRPSWAGRAAQLQLGAALVCSGVGCLTGIPVRDDGGWKSAAEHSLALDAGER